MKKNDNTALMTLQTSDLAAAGINTSLSTNDLVEVVAHDIYDKYMEQVYAIIKGGSDIQKRYERLMDDEFRDMKSALSKYLKKTAKVDNIEEDDFREDGEYSGVVQSFCKNPGDDYWPGSSVTNIGIDEKDRGTFVTTNSKTFSIPSIKQKSVRVKLTIKSGADSTEQEVQVGKIEGTIETKINKTFTQIVTVPIKRFADFHAEVNRHNKDVETMLTFLPKNKQLSVERFSREARVKMNKKILSSQSPEFKAKMRELFKISL